MATNYREISNTIWNIANHLHGTFHAYEYQDVILPTFLKQKDATVVQVYRRDSKNRTKKGEFTGVSNMIQAADFLTGLILSFADVHRKTLIGAEKHKNIYHKALLSKCHGIAEKCKMKTNYYWPGFEYQKINVFYWKKICFAK